MEEKINAVVFKLIPCCLTLKPLVTSRLPTELMLSRTCSCCARDESTVSASVRDHTRERDLPQQHRPRSPSSSWDAGKGRDAAGGVGSGWQGSGCSSAGVPSPQPESVSISPSWCLTVTHPKPGLAPTALDLGGLQWAAPILPCPHTLPCPLRSQLGQCQPWAWKHMGRNPSEGLCRVTHTLNTPSLLLKNSAPDNPHPHRSRGRERGSSTRRQLAWK